MNEKKAVKTEREYEQKRTRGESRDVAGKEKE